MGTKTVLSSSCMAGKQELSAVVVKAFKSFQMFPVPDDLPPWKWEHSRGAGHVHGTQVTGNLYVMEPRLKGRGIDVHNVADAVDYISLQWSRESGLGNCHGRAYCY